MKEVWPGEDQTSFFVSALPIFPGRRQPSILGAGELNCRVRKGNGWTLTAISTDFVAVDFVSLASAYRQKLVHSVTAFLPGRQGNPPAPCILTGCPVKTNLSVSRKRVVTRTRVELVFAA